MDNYVDERDYAVLEQDKYTFAVLSRVMGGECKLLLTDHERLIICYTEENRHYPVWIWTPDDISDDEKERVYELVQKHMPLASDMTYNLKYDPAEYFIRRANEENIKAKIQMNMFAYDCPKLIEPSVKADGEPYLCSERDSEQVTEFFKMYYADIGSPADDEHSRKTAENMIENNKYYFWKNREGKAVAGCGCMLNDKIISVNGVFTVKEYRRNHYAENLVHYVTKQILDSGKMPMLYTNADYVASNSCYTKLGYILRGKLCTLGVD